MQCFSNSFFSHALKKNLKIKCIFLKGKKPARLMLMFLNIQFKII